MSEPVDKEKAIRRLHDLQNATVAAIYALGGGDYNTALERVREIIIGSELDVVLDVPSASSGKRAAQERERREKHEAELARIPTREEADNARADAAHAVACVNAIPEIEAIAARLETGYADPSVGGGSHNEGVIAASRAIAVQIRAALAKAVKP